MRSHLKTLFQANMMLGMIIEPHPRFLPEAFDISQLPSNKVNRIALL